MNKVCKFCKHLQTNNNGGVECGKASFSQNGFGSFKDGCNCSFDDDLVDLFEPLNDTEDRGLQEMSEHVDRLKKQIVDYRETIRILKSRLLAIQEIERI